MSVLYPVPQPALKQTAQPGIQTAPFLPAAQVVIELPPLVMAPMTPAGWST